MKYEEHFTVRSNETDLHDILRPTQLVQYMQETADHQMRDQDVDYVKLYNEEHKAFVVSKMGIEIFEPVGKYSEITGRTWHVTGRAANFPRAYELVKDDKVFARAMSNWALLDTEKGKLVMYKDYDMSGYANDKKLKLDIPDRVRLPKDVDFHLVEESTVTRSLVDINRHMNNAMYLNKLYDHIPGADDMFITSINVRFVHEAPYEAPLKIYASDIMDAGPQDPRAEKVIWFYTETMGNKNIEAVFGLKSL